MIPLRDDNPRATRPVVVVALIAINVLVFFWELSLGPDLEFRLRTLALVPADFVANPGNAVPLFTSMFLHGSWMHLLGNMLYLWVFGDNLEDRMGRLRFLAFYLLCGLAAALCQVVFSARSSVPTLGASGAIAGVLGGYLVLYPRARVLTILPLFIFIKFIYVPAILYLAFWFVLQIVSGMASVGATEQGGVAYWAHIGGFVTGLVLVKLFAGAPRQTPWRRGPRWRDEGDRPDSPWGRRLRF